MQKLSFTFLAATLVLILPGCEVVGGIFKAGVWVGILAVVGIIAIIIWLVSRSKR